MKYSIVALLAFCAITAYATPVPGLGDYFNTSAIRNTIEELVAKGQEVYNNSVNRLFNQGKYVEEQLKKVADNAEAKVKELLNRAEEKFEELKKVGEHGRDCFEEYTPEFEKVRKETQEVFRKCFDETIANGQNLREELEKQLDEIRKKSSEMSQKVTDCISFNPYTFGKCIYQKWDELSAGLKDINILSQDVFQSGVNGGADLVKFATQCEASAYKKVYENVTDVVKSYVDCVQKPAEKETEKSVDAEAEKSAE